MRILIIGCGYLGQRAAVRWVAQGATVTALTRNATRAMEWRERGLEAVVGDVLAPESLKHLPEADLCLYAVGYDRSQSASKEAVYVGGLEALLQAVQGRCGRMIYISSSSVYGQDRGERVDENSETVPAAAGGQICLRAESAVLRAVEDRRLESAVILRLSGIYGPQRLLARTEQLRAGVTLSGNPQAWLNLIHVDDAVEAVLRLEDIPPMEPSLTYLLSDLEPMRRRDFYGLLAELCGAPAPVFAGDDAGLNKRCDSSRIRAALGLTLTYPTFREGLRQAIG